VLSCNIFRRAALGGVCRPDPAASRPKLRKERLKNIGPSSSPDAVKAVALNANGYGLPLHGVDGVYGPRAGRR